MKVILKYTILIVMVFCTMVGCASKQAKTLQVCSYDYKGLTELYQTPIDEYAIENWPYLTDDPYFDTQKSPYHQLRCCLSTTEGKLLISSKMQTNNTFIMEGNNGYFLGVDIGQFAGWVKYISYHSDITRAKEKLVANESCRGFLKFNNDEGLLFTAYANSESKTYEGKIYSLLLPDVHSQWQWMEIGQLSSIPLVYTYDADAETVYIVTLTELVAFSVRDCSIKTLADLSLWKRSGATSIVQLNDKLYIGMSMGIYEYDLTTQDSVWYAMDFERYAS